MNTPVLRTALAAAAITAALAACDYEPPPPISTTPVKAVDTPPPEYPLELACDGIGGRTVLSVTIGKDGKPANIDVKQSSGNATLDQAAQQAVEGWQFRAATTNDRPVETVIEVPMTFNVPKPRPERCFALDDKQY